MNERKRETLKLKDDNWIEWKAEVRGQLYFEKVSKAIVRPVVKDGATEKTTKDLEKEAQDDECARIIIDMYLSEEYLRKTEHCTKSWELWELLVSHFEAQNRNSIPTNVERLALLIQEPIEPENLTFELRGIAAKLGETKVNSDTFLVPLVAAMLPSDFNDLRTAIRTNKNLTLTEANNIVLKLEAKRKGLIQTVAAYKSKPPKSKKVCTYCNKRGHLQEDCWTKRKAEKQEEDTKSQDKPKDKTRVTMINEKVCRLSETERKSRAGRAPWYLDSGCGGHSACEEVGFIEINKNKRATLESAFGHEVEVKAIGTYEIKLVQDSGYIYEIATTRHD